MIFVTLGSQKFQFNRLLKEIDRLIEAGNIKEKVFAQTGYSDYEPRYYEYKKFLDREDFSNIMRSCDKVITHGGTGAIIGAIKNGKKVIAVPRLSMFGEHVDDHQLQIIKQFKEMNFFVGINEICELEKYLADIDKLEFDSYISNTENIINEIDKYIEGI